MDRYGKIKQADLVANDVRYNEQMDISQPIDSYFAYIDDCIQYASNGNMTYTTKQEQEVTAQAAGYTQASNAIQISNALDNLANAKIADKRTVEDLSKASMKLVKANKQLTNQVAQITEQLSVIIKLIEVLIKSTNVRGNGFGGNSARKKIDWDPHRYRWSCGFCLVKSHNSVACTSKKEGHQEVTTESNTMGGSQKNKNYVFS
eukprot:6086166-Ditylum_brightwellii.AAC.1